MITVESDDGRAVVHDHSGRGNPLLLAGGPFVERSHPAMTRVAEEFSQHLTVHDRRGRGDGGDADTCPVEGQIEDLAALTAEADGTSEVVGRSASGAPARDRGAAVEFFVVTGTGAPAEAVAGMSRAPLGSGLGALAHTLPYDSAVMGGFSPPVEEPASVRTPAFTVLGAGTEQCPHRSADAVAVAVPELKNFCTR